MLQIVKKLITRLNPPRQTIKFKQQTKIAGAVFEANLHYTFKVVRLGHVRWLIYRGKQMMTLDSFANLYVDQKYAKWVDKQIAA